MRSFPLLKLFTSLSIVYLATSQQHNAKPSHTCASTDIELLTNIAETLKNYHESRTSEQAQVNKYTFFQAVKSHEPYKKKASSPENYDDILRSFELTIENNHSYALFLQQPLFSRSIYEAPASLHQSKANTPHCVSFVDEFGSSNPEKSISSYTPDLTKRVRLLLKKIGKEATKSPTPGDTIVYQQQGELAHVAIYVGEVNKVPYAISKWGNQLGVYIHPVDCVLSSYGKPMYYARNAGYHEATYNRKLIEIKQTILNHQAEVAEVDVNGLRF